MAKREYGAGGIEWLSNYKVRLSIRIETPDGRVRRTKTVKVAHRDHGGRGEAAAELESFMAKETAKASAKPSRTLDHLMGHYIAERERIGRSQSTVEGYGQIRKRIAPWLAAKDIAELGPDDLNRFYSDLKASGLAPNTIRIQHGVMGAALNEAVRVGWIAGNPAARATPPDEEDNIAEPLPPADVMRMAVAALAPTNKRKHGDIVLAMAIILAALTGARRGELCGLRWDDLDVASCSIKILRQWVPGKGGQRLETPKSKAGTRTVFLGVEGLREVENYRAVMRRLLDREPEGWLLSYDAGTTPLRAKSLGQAITDTAKDIGLTVTTHRFRKVQATQLAAAGIDVDTAARRMGQTKEVMFTRYMLGAEDKAIAAGDVVEARLIEQGFTVGGILGQVIAEKELTE